MDVLAIQRALNARGHDLGRSGRNRDGVDGDFGPVTIQALKVFQAGEGLVATSNPDLQTRVALGVPALSPPA
ncbi:peptidoglycan-binding domain-containing protein [Microvirga antarctica]|uniref:peptidoglycan-binding domain-containing protein n=1 Tax=Microvirga antarctica TaxID=2819233 RepID=UPI001B30E365|nr:peptidoglycan-binding domain-containing protein [Microvirga antarctica]